MPTQQQVANTNKLINFLENEVHPDKFDLSHWVGQQVGDNGSLADPFTMAKDPSKIKECNTSACVVGWLPYLFPNQAKWYRESNIFEWTVVSADSSPYGIRDVFCTITGISFENSAKIIYKTNNNMDNYESTNPTPKEVATRIRQMVAEESLCQQQ